VSLAADEPEIRPKLTLAARQKNLHLSLSQI